MTGNGREEGREAYVDHVIERAVLCNSDEDGLVVRGGVDRGKAVGSSRETTRDVSGEDAVLRGAVEALEERELGRVEGRGLVERGEGLDDDVRVAGDVAVGRDRLGRGEVVLVRVHERARVQVLDRHLDREVLVRGDRLPVLGEHELGRGHVRLCGDDTHRRGVAGAGRDLLAVGDREVRDRRAEVDEVVRRRERGDLAGLSNVLAVVREALGDDRVKERCWVKSGVSRVRGTIVKILGSVRHVLSEVWGSLLLLAPALPVAAAEEAAGGAAAAEVAALPPLLALLPPFWAWLALLPPLLALAPPRKLLP